MTDQDFAAIQAAFPGLLWRRQGQEAAGLRRITPVRNELEASFRVEMPRCWGQDWVARWQNRKFSRPSLSEVLAALAAAVRQGSSQLAEIVGDTP